MPSLTRRYRTKHGEIDIVARDGETLVFVEVKARRDGSFGDPEESVTLQKQQRLVWMATDYLVRQHVGEVACRFDVVGINTGDHAADGDDHPRCVSSGLVSVLSAYACRPVEPLRAKLPRTREHASVSTSTCHGNLRQHTESALRLAAPSICMRMSELRRDPITGRWVIIAPERSRRPEDFAPHAGGRPRRRHVSLLRRAGGDCRARAAGVASWRRAVANGPGWRVRVVANREPALRVESTLGEAAEPLFQSWGGLGAHEVVIESADHRATLATMSAEDGLAGSVGLARTHSRSAPRHAPQDFLHRQERWRRGRRDARSSAFADSRPAVLAACDLSVEIAGATSYHVRAMRAVCSAISISEEKADGNAESSRATMMRWRWRRLRRVCRSRSWVLPRAH